jgi:hypothetical protein
VGAKRTETREGKWPTRWEDSDHRQRVIRRIVGRLSPILMSAAIAEGSIDSFCKPVYRRVYTYGIGGGYPHDYKENTALYERE